MFMLKESDAYKLSKQYISTNLWVQQEVGNTIEFGIIQSSKVFNGASGKANLTIHVSGDKGEITVATVLEKKGGEWQIIKAATLIEKIFLLILLHLMIPEVRFLR